jgi:hypothetical protein
MLISKRQSADASQRGIAQDTAMILPSAFTFLSVGAMAIAASSSVLALESIDVIDGQYTAELEQHAHRWHLLPLRGDTVEVTDRSSDCGSRMPIPNGLWYVTQDTDGRALLIAPSGTTLPAGFPDHIALRACGDGSASDATLFVPAVALTWIHSNVGTVKIDD